MKKIEIKQDGVRVKGKVRSKGDILTIKEGIELDILTRNEFAKIIGEVDG